MAIAKGLSQAIQEALAEYMKLEVKVPLEQGKSLTVNPQYASVHYRSSTLKMQEFIDGVPMQDLPSASRDQSMRFSLYAGNSPHGSGTGIASFPSCGEKAAMIKKSLRKTMDSIVKVAAGHFLQGLGESIITTTPEQLQRIGRNEKIIYNQPIQTDDLSLKEIGKLVLKFMVPLYHHDQMVKLAIGKEREDSLFVDSIGSEIFQQQRRIQINMAASGTDRYQRDFTHVENLFFTSPHNLTEDLLRQKVERLAFLCKEANDPVRVSSGKYPVLLDGKAVGTFFHEAIAAHLLSGKYVVAGASHVYPPERLGKLVLPEYINIRDAPSTPDGLGSYEYDEEGVKAQDIVLVENGILRNYLLDKDSAAKLSRLLNQNIISNGRARSQWVKEGDTLLPLEPRVTNLAVTVEANHLKSERALWAGFKQQIADNRYADYGILVEGSDGEVQIEDGMFKLLPQTAWRVDKNGHKKLLREVVIVSHLDHLFGDVIDVGLPYKTSYGFCGAMSGYVPTQERAPSFLLRSMSIIDYGADSSTPKLSVKLEK